MSAEPWDVKVFRRHLEDDPSENCPAEEFLIQCPRSVAEDLFAIVDAVAASPPPQFPGGGMGEAMHGELAGFYEARTRGPDRRLCGEADGTEDGRVGHQLMHLYFAAVVYNSRRVSCTWVHFGPGETR